MEYYSAIKRNEIELFVVRWMDLKTVIQSEVSQEEKNKYHMLGASLVAEWLRIRVPIQATWVRSLARDDPTCRTATKSMSHNY